MDGAASAWVADECAGALGQKSSPEATKQHAAFAQAAKIEGRDTWNQIDVFEPRKNDNVSRQNAPTRRILTWMMVGGRKSIKARLVAKGYQDPHLRGGIVDTPGRVSIRSSHLQMISLRAIEK